MFENLEKLEQGMKEPIDFVVPMVFPQDVEWQKDFHRVHGGKAETKVRWRSWGTEDLLVECVNKYMPWVHRIFIILARESQVQEWMRELRIKDERIRIVFHADFIPKEYLPCFTSPCIEMFLHRIPGLSEHFIYANDDMFPLSPLKQEDFFRPDEATGALLPCQKFNEKEYPTGATLFQRKCRNQLNMIAGAFGKKYRKTYLKSSHSFAAILKSSCKDVWAKHGDEITRHISPVSRTDRSYNHYIYQLEQQFSGKFIEYSLTEHYVGKKVRTNQIAGIIRDPGAGVVCINDNSDINDWQKRAAIERKEISEKLRMRNEK